MNCLDANFATALHFNIRGQTELAEKFVRKNSEPFVFTARVLAASCRLRVDPNLTVKDKGRIAH